MKVTAIKTYVAPSALSSDDWCRGSDFVLVKVETDAGIDGWGEAYSGLHDCDPGLIRSVAQVGAHADGLDPFRIKYFTATVRERFADTRRGANFHAAVSAIEIALWDIVGKALGAPVHRLMGGQVRDRISVYANCWSHIQRSPEELAAYARRQVDKGFRAVKVYPFLYSGGIAEGARRLAAVRETLGPDIEILVDAWMKMDGEDIAAVADILRRYGVRWFEDPISPVNNVAALAEIRRRARLPIVSGENLSTKHAFFPLLEQGAADILHPDTTLCGGLLELKEISVMAELFSARVAIHNYNSMGVGLAASLQIAAVIPNLVKLEHFPRFVAPSRLFSRHGHALGEDGCIGLTTEPGLGVEVDEGSKALRAVDAGSGAKT
jgi:galactonate dehydratase